MLDTLYRFAKFQFECGNYSGSAEYLYIVRVLVCVLFVLFFSRFFHVIQCCRYIVLSLIRPSGVTPWGLIKRCCLFIFFIFFLYFFYFLSYPPSSQDGSANPQWGYTMSWGPSGIGKLSRQIFPFRPLNFTGGRKPLIFRRNFDPTRLRITVVSTCGIRSEI